MDISIRQKNEAGFKAAQYEIDEEGLDIIPEVINIEYDEYRKKWRELNRLEKTFDFNHDEYTFQLTLPFPLLVR